MNKRGQIDLSFGMIFSIIIIIAIIGVSIYVITNFVRLGKCSNIGLFYNELKNEVDKAWSSTTYRDIFNGKLPNGIEFVCFGELNSARPDGKEGEAYDFLLRYKRQDKNVFLYPTQNACDSNLAFYRLENAKIEGFFCIPAEKGIVKIGIEKDRFDALVKLKK